MWRGQRYGTHEYEWDKAAPFFATALPVARALRDTFGIAITLRQHAYAAQLAGRIDVARRDYAEAARLARRIGARAAFPTVLLFQLALPSEIPGYVLGIVRCRPAIYLAALALAELPYAVGTVYLGESFVRGDYALLVGLGAVGIAGIATAFHHLHRRLGGDAVVTAQASEPQGVTPRPPDGV